MPNQKIVVLDGLFSIVHVETVDNGEIDCLSVLVYDSRDGLLKSIYEACVKQDTADGSDHRAVSLKNAMQGLSNTCRGTILVAFEVAAVSKFVRDACDSTGVEYPFAEGNDVDVKLLAASYVGNVSGGAVGLRGVAQRLGIRMLPSSDAPSWGAVACWYILKRITKI